MLTVLAGLESPSFVVQWHSMHWNTGELIRQNALLASASQAGVGLSARLTLADCLGAGAILRDTIDHRPTNLQVYKYLDTETNNDEIMYQTAITAALTLRLDVLIVCPPNDFLRWYTYVCAAVRDSRSAPNR